ncbi:hypothetical protein ES703_10225 [subsurface metagenome]
MKGSISAVKAILYSKVRKALKDKAMDPDKKKMLACKYVYFMADLRSGMKRRDLLKEQYREVLTLIEETQHLV